MILRRGGDLAFAHRLLGALPVVNVGHQAIPADDVPLRITSRVATKVKPAIDAVVAFQSRFEFHGVAGPERSRKRFEMLLEIIGMDCAAFACQF